MTDSSRAPDPVSSDNDWPEDALNQAPTTAADGQPAGASAGPNPGEPAGLDGLIKLVSVERIAPNPRNARTHSPEQVARLADLIRHYGFTNPGVFDTETGDLLAGHGRLAALTSIWGAGEEVRLPSGQVLPRGFMPIVDAAGWDEGKRRAYMLADNAIALDAGWDDKLLRAELFALRGMDVPLALSGFGDAQIVQFMAKGGVTAQDPDEVPPEPEAPVSRPGDIWVLGGHRLICGDATDPEVVKALLGDDVPALMVTDPPYGVAYDASWRTTAQYADGRALSTGNHATGVVRNDDRADWTEAFKLFPGSAAYVWHGGLHAGEVQRNLSEAGLVVRSQVIWAKPVLVIGRGDYHWKHEPCWYAVRPGAKANWQGSRKESTIWDIPNMHRTQGSVDDGRTAHSTQKPVECMARPIRNNSAPGDGVYEPFSGSGSTIIAAEMLRRRCFAVELNPAYVDMAVDRWQRYTGQRATRLQDGVAFADLQAA